MIVNGEVGTFVISGANNCKVTILDDPRKMLAHCRLDNCLEIENEKFIVRTDRKEPKGVRPPANICCFDNKPTVRRPGRSLIVSICVHSFCIPIYSIRSPQRNAVG